MTDNAQPDIVYALNGIRGTALRFAARSTGLYRSEDGGQSWRAAYETLDFDLEGPLPTTSVALSPGFAREHSDEHDPSAFAGVPGGVLRSTDGGHSWHVAPFGTPPPTVTALAISPHFVHDGVLLAGTMEDGVFRSADRGASWVSWNFGLLDLNVFCLAISPDFAEDETIFAGVESGVFRSTNGGRAWREVDLPVGFEPVLSLAFSPNFAEDGVLFAGTETQDLLRSRDRGRTWEQLDGVAGEGAVNAVALCPAYAQTPRVLIARGDALWLSQDGGEAWAPLPLPEGLAQVTAVLALEGLAPGAPLLVGTAQGTVAHGEVKL